jgi:hypothetical protein
VTASAAGAGVALSRGLGRRGSLRPAGWRVLAEPKNGAKRPKHRFCDSTRQHATADGPRLICCNHWVCDRSDGCDGRVWRVLEREDVFSRPEWNMFSRSRTRHSLLSHLSHLSHTLSFQQVTCFLSAVACCRVLSRYEPKRWIQPGVAGEYHARES